MARSWSKSETDLAIRLRMQGRTFAEVRAKLIEQRWAPRSIIAISDRFDRCANDQERKLSVVIKGINMRRGRGVPIEMRRMWVQAAKEMMETRHD